MIFPLADLPPTGPYAEPRPSMRGRYLMRDAKKATAMTMVDAALSLVAGRGGAVPSAPRNILVANWAHLGDVIISLGVLSALRQRYPEAAIGVVVGSWGRAAVAATGLADRLHVIDHWRLNRSDKLVAEKRAQYKRTREEAMREIAGVGYDIAIDLQPFFPPAHLLFRAAGIPVRVGFTSSGFGALLTHPCAWHDDDRPLADHYRTLLDVLDPARPFAPADLRPRRDPATLVPLPAEIDIARPYIVLHPGAGIAFKDWGIDRWAALVTRLRTEWPGVTLVLTGAGAGEAATTRTLAAAAPGMVDMAGRAGWEEFVSIVAHAALVICPDTATGHVAALFDVPVVSLFTGTNKAGQWRPYSDNGRVLVRPVRCAPCNRAGCEVMACVRDIPVEAVVSAAAELLPPAA